MRPGRLAPILLVLLAGCAQPPPGGPPVASEDENVHLYVSNQSFEQPVADLLVEVDGVALFDGEAKVEGQHNWMLRETTLPPGTYSVEALERATGTRMHETFTMPAGGADRWLVVDFWRSEDEGPRFTFSVHERQVVFD